MNKEDTSAEYRKGWHDGRNNGREICKECHLKDTVYDLLSDLKVANLKPQRNKVLEEVALEIDKMKVFEADTMASIAAFIRDMKK
jgi:hypothetical protein